MAEFSIALDNNGNVGPIKLKDIPGIPDRMMGQTDNTGNNDNHNFLYLPLVSTTSGQTWLNHNLGSATSSINKASDYGTGCTFNFTQDASSKTDHCSYGSLFQWGRKADGHELMKEFKKAREGQHIVLVTADDSIESIQRAISAGANGYVVKPYSQEKIHDVISNYAVVHGGDAAIMQGLTRQH